MSGKDQDDNGGKPNKKGVDKEGKKAESTRKRRYEMMPLLPCRARHSWAETLDYMERKYSKMEEEMAPDENDEDLIDFFEDSVEEIMEKIQRSEEKVKKWMEKSAGDPESKGQFLAAQKSAFSAANEGDKKDEDSDSAEKDGEDQDEDDDDSDDDQPTSTVYLGLKK